MADLGEARAEMEVDGSVSLTECHSLRDDVEDTRKVPCTPANSLIDDISPPPPIDVRWPAQSETNTVASTAGSFESTAGNAGSPRPLPTSIETPISAPSSSRLQSFVVARHGERLDSVDPYWVSKSDRPWDPPLSENGLAQAWELGRRLRDLGITRVVTSPFLRCVQTAAQLIAGLADSENPGLEHSEVRVSVDYAVGEVMNAFNIRVLANQVVDPATKWTLPLETLESYLPPGALDPFATPTSSQCPKWPEEDTDAFRRFLVSFDAIADQFPMDNIVVVTHGFGVACSMRKLMACNVYGVDFCGFTHAQRPIFHGQPQEESDWEVVTKDDSTNVHFTPLR